jgi:drug/metabolite transporter (DMT)-like permease
MRNALILLAGVVLVSAGGLFARVGLDAGADGYLLALWRVTIAAAILWPLAGARPLRDRPSRSDNGRLAVAGLFMALHFVTWLMSMRYISVVRSTLLVSTSPLWAGLVDQFVPSRRPGKGFWVGLALAAIGIALFTSPALGSETGRFLHPAWIGDLLALAGAVFIVPYLVLSQQVQTRIGTLPTVSRIYLAGAAFLWVFALPLGEARVPWSTPIWIAVAGMALLSHLLGHTTLNRSLKHFSSGQVTSATLLEPVFAGGFAWILFAERLEPWQILGGAVLLVGVAFALRVPPPK